MANPAISSSGFEQAIVDCDKELINRKRETMSKLLKKVLDEHMPHLSPKLTAENGYDPVKHRTVTDLHKAQLINDKEKAAIDSCIDDLSFLNDDSHDSKAAKMLKAVDSGDVNADSLNDDDAIRAFMASIDRADADDDKTDSDEGIVA